jgi:hypothetical protein
MKSISIIFSLNIMSIRGQKFIIIIFRESAGSLYHIQLARQLGDWLQKPLERFGGMIALTDLYCLFNRARGTELISPGIALI